MTTGATFGIEEPARMTFEITILTTGAYRLALEPDITHNPNGDGYLPGMDFE